MSNRKNPYVSLAKSILAQPSVPPKILSKPKLQDYGLSEAIIKKNEIDKKEDEYNQILKFRLIQLLFVVFCIIFCKGDFSDGLIAGIAGAVFMQIYQPCFIASL